MNTNVVGKCFDVNFNFQLSTYNIYYVNLFTDGNPTLPPYLFMLGQGVKKSIFAILPLDMGKKAVTKISKTVKGCMEKNIIKFFRVKGRGCDYQ